MQNSDLVSSFAEIAREKGIDRDSLQLIVEDVFKAMIRKRYGSDDSFEIILNPDHGDMQILHIREVVDDWALGEHAELLAHFMEALGTESTRQPGVAVGVRKGQWALQHNGVVADAFKGVARAHEATHWRTTRSLNQIARLVLPLYTEPTAAMLVRAWVSTMQYP